MTMTEGLPRERVALSALRPHPRNYRAHPPEQLEHIRASLNEHGQYRNVVVAEDYTILAGHGVVSAAGDLGWETIDVVRLAITANSAPALRLLTGDNEMGRLAIMDDHALAELLKDVQVADPLSLLGTGFDEAMLAGLVYVTKPRSEIESMDEAAEWAGMPEFEGTDRAPKIVITFDTFEGRQQFADELGMFILKKSSDSDSRIWSTRWPPREREDIASVAYEG